MKWRERAVGEGGGRGLWVKWRGRAVGEVEGEGCG